MSHSKEGFEGCVGVRNSCVAKGTQRTADLEDMEALLLLLTFLSLDSSFGVCNHKWSVSTVDDRTAGGANNQSWDDRIRKMHKMTKASHASANQGAEQGGRDPPRNPSIPFSSLVQLNSAKAKDVRRLTGGKCPEPRDGWGPRPAITRKGKGAQSPKHLFANAEQFGCSHRNTPLTHHPNSLPLQLFPLVQ